MTHQNSVETINTVNHALRLISVPDGGASLFDDIADLASLMLLIIFFLLIVIIDDQWDKS